LVDHFLVGDLSRDATAVLSLPYEQATHESPASAYRREQTTPQLHPDFRNEK